MEQISLFDNHSDIDESQKQTCSKTNSVMCLWNGEYEEHDLSHINGLEGIKKNQARIYHQYIGITIGDFTCLDVEYDWGRRDQRWRVKCNLCGEESFRYHTGDWRRGKGGSTFCHCRKDVKKHEIESRKLTRESAIKEETGKSYGRYKVIEYKGYDACRVQCEKCGAIRRKGVTISNLKQGIYPKCDCGKPHYSDPKWIGMRFGHLVVESHSRNIFFCRCDCGRDRACNQTLLSRGVYRDCGTAECEYISDKRADALAAKSRGETYEVLASAIIESNGYKTKLIGRTGDFGVDIIATDKQGNKIAVQCKSNTTQLAGVDAVQQVYAGGRYYGIERFAVISHSGYSVNAIKMARKLGVYLSDGKTFEYPSDLKKYADTLIPTVKARNNIKARKIYEINGQEKTLANIAFENGISEDKIRKGLRKGLTIENAINYAKDEHGKWKTYTVQGVTGTIGQLCDHFRVVSPECASYRIKHGIPVERAILTEKMRAGRPKKERNVSEEYGQTKMAI